MNKCIFDISEELVGSFLRADSNKKLCKLSDEIFTAMEINNPDDYRFFDVELTESIKNGIIECDDNTFCALDNFRQWLEVHHNRYIPLLHYGEGRLIIVVEKI